LARPEGSERAYVQAREYDLQLEAKLGKRRLVTEATPQAQVGGYWCEVCQCTLRDNMTYLDHINGRPHQARLGFSVRAERSTVDQVKARFERLKAQQKGGPGGASSGGAGRMAALDADDRYALAAMDAPSIHMVAADKASVGAPAPAGASSSSSAAAAPAGAKRPRVDGPAGDGGAHSSSSSASSSASSSGAPKSGDAPAAAAASGDGGGGEEEIDPELAAMMGFSGFGGGKNR
jgi:hypothetical protein